VVRSKLLARANRARRDDKLSQDQWLKWASAKQGILQFRSRLNAKHSVLRNAHIKDWKLWASRNKNKLRSVETLWQKKYRKWQNALRKRSQVEPT
jgi:hypothetical protein